MELNAQFVKSIIIKYPMCYNQKEIKICSL
jgi:hypothetical protein